MEILTQSTSRTRRRRPRTANGHGAFPVSQQAPLGVLQSVRRGSIASSPVLFVSAQAVQGHATVGSRLTKLLRPRRSLAASSMRRRCQWLGSDIFVVWPKGFVSELLYQVSFRLRRHTTHCSVVFSPINGNLRRERRDPRTGSG